MDKLARILARKIARVGRQVGKDCRACPARGKLSIMGKSPRAGARRLPREDSRAEVGEDVRVGVAVGVGVGRMEFKLNQTH